MSESASFVSEDFIEEEEVLIFEEVIEEVIEEEIVEDDDCDESSVEVDFNDGQGPRRVAQNRRQSEASCEYMEMTLAEDEFMSFDDLDDAEERQKTRNSYHSQHSQQPQRQQSSRRMSDDSVQLTGDDADATNSSDDGFDLALPETSNMENMHMSGLTLMDFTQSGMINFESSYIFELIDTDDEEELEAAEHNAEMIILEDETPQLSLNPYRAAMDKVRGGPLGKRRSTGPIGKRRSTGPGPKRRSTSRPLSPTRRQVTDYLENEARRQSGVAPPTRKAPPRTHSGMRRGANRRSLITSPIQEDKPHAPSVANARRGGKRASLLANLPSFAKDPNLMEPMEEGAKEGSTSDHRSTSRHNTTAGSKASNSSDLSSLKVSDLYPPNQGTEQRPIPEPSRFIDVPRPPSKNLLPGGSNHSNVSELTPTPGLSRGHAEENAAIQKSSDPSTVIPVPPSHDDVAAALQRTKGPAAAAPPPPQTNDASATSDADVAAPVGSIAGTKSGNSDVSPLTASGHPPGSGTNRMEERNCNSVPLHNIDESAASAPPESITGTKTEGSELSPLTPPRMQPAGGAAGGTKKMQVDNDHDDNAAVPTEAITRTRSGNSDMSPLTASGHPRGDKMEASYTPVRREASAPLEAIHDVRVPMAEAITRSTSGNSEMSPLTASGHPRASGGARMVEARTSGRNTPIESIDAGTKSHHSSERSPDLSPLPPRRGPSVPKVAIANTNKSNVELSPLTASGHPGTRAKMMEGNSSRLMENPPPPPPIREVPLERSSLSNSGSSELSPLTSSGRALNKAEDGNNLVRNNDPTLPTHNEVSPIMESSSDYQVRSKSDREADRTPQSSISRTRARSSRDGSGDTDRRLLRGILEDTSSWNLAEGKVLEIEFPENFKIVSSSQDSFSTLDSESFAADSLMSSTRFEPTPQQVMQKRSSDVSPIPPRRPMTSPKVSAGGDSKGTRKTAMSAEHSRRRSEGNRRRSLDLHSVTEDKQNARWDASDSINSNTMTNNNRRNYMRRDLSMSSFTNHSRRNLLKRQSSNPLMQRQHSMSSFANTSRRNLMGGSRQSSRRSIMDESPSLPRRFIVDAEMQDSNLHMSMSSLASQSRASRERRNKIQMDKSPMRPRRTLDKVVSPGVKTDDDDESSEASSHKEPLPTKDLPSDSLPQSMKRERDLSPVRPRRTRSAQKVLVVNLFDDTDDEDSEALPKNASPPKDEALPKASPPKDDDIALKPDQKDDSQYPPSSPSTVAEEEKKETEMPIFIIPDYIPPPPPLPKRGVPAEVLRARRSFTPREETVEIEIKEQEEDRLSPLPQSSTDKVVKNLKESPSPTECTANTIDSENHPSLDKVSPAMSRFEPVSQIKEDTPPPPLPSSSAVVLSKVPDSSQPPLAVDTEAISTLVQEDESPSNLPSSPANLSGISDSSQSLATDAEAIAPSPRVGLHKYGEDSFLHSSSDTDGSFVSGSSTRKRRHARATLEKLNTQMNSTFGVGMKSPASSAGYPSPANTSNPNPESRRVSLEERRMEARAARERLRQRFTSARARVQSELPM